jgi:hypothetical protein
MFSFSTTTTKQTCYFNVDKITKDTNGKSNYGQGADRAYFIVCFTLSKGNHFPLTNPSLSSFLSLCILVVDHFNSFYLLARGVVMATCFHFHFSVSSTNLEQYQLIFLWTYSITYMPIFSSYSLLFVESLFRLISVLI